MTSKKLYFENLDGLRFLCFLSVFFYHSFYTEFTDIKSTSAYQFVKINLVGNGNLGVNFFFVLSGFLITYLLIEEKTINTNINLKNFWLRRILRIWPLYFFCVFFGFVVFPLLKQSFGQTPNENASLLSFLTFTNNLDFIYNGPPDASVLGVLWSVAIEEQFYLVWPIILFLLPVRKYWIAFAVIIVGSFVFRANFDDPEIHEKHTISCIADMAMGSLGAWLIWMSARFRHLIENLSKLQIAVIYIFFFMAFFFREQLFYANYGMRIFERFFISIGILLIILEQCYAKNSFFKLSKFKFISGLGKITYGLYCLHFIAILITLVITRKLGLNSSVWEVLILETSIALVITIIISSLSFKYFEKPFLKLKEKFAYK
ncbi:MAG: acyltransferase [Bacteroidetes bacterium]|nr:acyltransferase [Bacteroidota bacterium]